MKRTLLRGRGSFTFWTTVESYQLLEEKKSKTNQYNPFDIINGPFGEMRATGKYNLLIQANVTEEQVGLSSEYDRKYLVTWELIREENINGLDYMIFTGWGDPMNGGHQQFEGHEIGIEKEMFLEYFGFQVNNSPDYFSKQKVQNIVGLENVNIFK